MSKTNTEDATVVTIYLPTAAANTDVIGSKYDDLRADVRGKFAEYAGGFTEYEAKGGWKNEDGDVITEDVCVLEGIVAESDDITAEVFAKVTMRHIHALSDETVVMGQVGDTVVTVE